MRHHTQEIHLVAGTRPEAIKLAPVAAQIAAVGRLRPVMVASGQHSHPVRQALAAFGTEPDVSLTVRRRNGGQPELLAGLVRALDAHLTARRPAAMVVQGDTTTTLAGALAAFWHRVPVVHVEAGLRSGNLESPFPEEANRKLVAQISRLHLAPTSRAATNLLGEGVAGSQVLLTGNTAVDAVQMVAARGTRYSDPRLALMVTAASEGDIRLMLVTAHRRESWGEPLEHVLKAVKAILAEHTDVVAVVPSHPNPAVQQQIQNALAHIPRAVVTGSLPYAELTGLLSHAYLVLTDSGGLQEEAPSFRVPVLVLRDVTERMESVEAGCAKLVGTDEATIIAEARALLTNPEARAAMVAQGNPYGDGRAAERTEQALAALLDLDAFPMPMPPLEFESGRLVAEWRS